MSYGGWFTLNYGICAPERLDSVVLLSPGGSFRTEGLRFNLRAYASVIFPFLPQRLLFDWFVRAMIVEGNLHDPVFFAVNERVGHQMYLGLKHFRVWQNWRSQRIEPHVFPDEELRGMHVPTLLLIGQQEILYDPVAALERARMLVPNLEAELIPQANHSMTIEQHEVVDKRIVEFLKASPKDLPISRSAADSLASGRPAADTVSAR
jgi:pimeloyl-ACP methyl ester carboxylesterase